MACKFACTLNIAPPPYLLCWICHALPLILGIANNFAMALLQLMLVVLATRFVIENGTSTQGVHLGISVGARVEPLSPTILQ